MPITWHSRCGQTVFCPPVCLPAWLRLPQLMSRLLNKRLIHTLAFYMSALMTCLSPFPHSALRYTILVTGGACAPPGARGPPHLLFWALSWMSSFKLYCNVHKSQAYMTDVHSVLYVKMFERVFDKEQSWTTSWLFRTSFFPLATLGFSVSTCFLSFSRTPHPHPHA